MLFRHWQAGLSLLQAALKQFQQHEALLSESDLEITSSLAGKGVGPRTSMRATAMQVLQVQNITVSAVAAVAKVKPTEQSVSDKG